MSSLSFRAAAAASMAKQVSLKLKELGVDDGSQNFFVGPYQSLIVITPYVLSELRVMVLLRKNMFAPF